MRVVLLLSALAGAAALVPRRAKASVQGVAARPQTSMLTLNVEGEAGDAAPPSDFDVKEQIISDLMLASNMRDEEALVKSLQAAMKFGLPADFPQVRQAREVYVEITTGVSTNMRSKLMREMQSSGADETIGWNPGFTYLAIFGLISVLVVLGGKGIFY
uniref:Uncharacterized protein n=1 Tax=Phaeomonas parva TaxID=124430 RepID=A0A7S1TNV0_9STRA|mmetsp:Transcript_10021/g.29625  ORF Transcript_10021/g.29625 Transcript_10021/m.29625 type:complete len:159 (+) Transcript_10021:361-837(+)